MVIAGGDWQIELVKKAKRMGYYVICSNLYKNSPAFPFADACEVADILDKDKNLAIAKKYKPDAVISDQSDLAVPTVAYLNEKLGLPGIGKEKAALFTDKFLLREYCRKNSITIPDYKICCCSRDAEEMLDKYGKIIIKPIDSQSSRGVFSITTRSELKNHYLETISYSNKRSEFLAEEYIDGDEFTIDGLVINGNHFPLCISIKDMYQKNPNISRMQTYTYSHPVYNYDQLRRANHDLIMKIGLPFGLTHTEYKFHNNKFYLIESGARGGGSNLSAKIVPFMSEVDNYEYLIRSALGEKIEVDPQEWELPKNKCVIMRFFDFGEGTVKSIKGKEYLTQNHNVLDYQLEIKIGDTLKNPKYGRLRPGHFTIGGNNLEKLQEEMNVILSKVTISFEKN